MVINNTSAVDVRIQAVLAPDNSVVSAKPMLGAKQTIVNIDNVNIFFIIICIKIIRGENDKPVANRAI